MNKDHSKQNTQPAVGSSAWLGDPLLPVNKPLARISIHLMVDTPGPIMDQIEFDVRPEQAESLREAEHLMVHVSIWEDGGTPPSREGHLVFPPDMFRSPPQSNHGSPACAIEPGPTRPT